jgi:hypothetical protein
LCRVSFFPTRPSQQLVETRISATFAAAPLIHVVQVEILLLAEGASAAKRQIIARLIRILVAAFDGGVRVRLVLKGDEAVVAAALAKVKTNIEDGSEDLEALPQIGLERALRNAAHVDDAPFVDLLLRLGCGALRASRPNCGVAAAATGGGVPTAVKVVGVVNVVVAGRASPLAPVVRGVPRLLYYAPPPIRPVKRRTNLF